MENDDKTLKAESKCSLCLEFCTKLLERMPTIDRHKKFFLNPRILIDKKINLIRKNGNNFNTHESLYFFCDSQ